MEGRKWSSQCSDAACEREEGEGVPMSRARGTGWSFRRAGVGLISSGRKQEQMREGVQ